MVVLSQSSFYSCFLLLLRHVAAQNNSTIDDSSNEENMSKPTLAFVIVGFSLLGFFFVLRFISIYKQTQTAEIENGRSSSDLRNSERGSGLNMSVIETFPKLFYSTFKKVGIDKEALMCPVCLNEFKEVETVRLIPQCCHAFHPDCVDIWLRSHSTCPVCRANLVLQVSDESVSLLDTPCPAKITIENFRCGCEIQIKVLG